MESTDEEKIMLIRDRIFDKLEEMNMTQKEFSECTGIPQTTISDWRKKRTNPTAEKIMIICKVLEVTPEWLLSGIDSSGDRGNAIPWYIIDRDSELGAVVSEYHRLDEKQRARLMGYMEALRR